MSSASTYGDPQMRHTTLKTHLFFIVLLSTCSSFATSNTLTWRGHYENAVPLKKGIPISYCHHHSPGIFIHTVKDVLTHPIVTNKGITLTKSTFNIDHVGKVYLMHGEITAIGKQNKWHDHIHYFLYKDTEDGVTKGIWYTNKCKGQYTGIVLRKTTP